MDFLPQNHWICSRKMIRFAAAKSLDRASRNHLCCSYTIDVLHVTKSFQILLQNYGISQCQIHSPMKKITNQSPISNQTSNYQSFKQPMEQSINQPFVREPIKQPTNQSINQSTNSSILKSVDQSTNQSINQPVFND